MKLFQFVNESQVGKEIGGDCLDVYLDILKYKKYTFLNISMIDLCSDGLKTSASITLFDTCLLELRFQVFGLSFIFSFLSWTYLT